MPWDRLTEEFGEGDRWAGRNFFISAGVEHTFRESGNYGILDDGILLRDFGDPGVPEFLREYGLRIRRVLARLLHGL